MKEKFRQFMIGRYGTDSLNQFLSIVAIATFVLYLVTRLQLFNILFFVIWGYHVFRMMSRNISKRTAENYRFYNYKTAFFNTISSKKNQSGANRNGGNQNYNYSARQSAAQKNNANYRYYRCPQCTQKLRVPRGRGKIEICCPKCGKQFLKKT